MSNTNLTYVIPDKPIRPFDKGDCVDVMNRTGAVLSASVRIIAESKKLGTVEIEGGREFRASDGHWCGHDEFYPFPWIRHHVQ